MRRLSALLISIWLGVHIGFGIAAYNIFSKLSHLSDGKILAGNIAGVLFSIVNWFGLLAWLLVFIIARQDNQRRSYDKSRIPAWTIVLLVLIAVNQFLFSPVIAALKTQQSNWLHSLIGGGFGMWHGLSYVIYMIAGLVGLGLCIRLLRLDEQRY
ncbi:DUF4149 domain-containing protein [Kingella negevensis]|uniref:DUF4149 domain-containing protein n=1 Tax=Kingella negevensis TaxID=1522312 RepID=UPI00050A1876|nr:DUF4149 domain-containing protein [Kingella negevensis]MDK4689541.1 DUF4149 domain-containing protein [Kingella negevensis]WII90798.1 DUF4149 domain-containing protein [Kingella negevensis]